MVKEKIGSTHDAATETSKRMLLCLPSIIPRALLSFANDAQAGGGVGLFTNSAAKKRPLRGYEDELLPARQGLFSCLVCPACGFTFASSGC